MDRPGKTVAISTVVQTSSKTSNLELEFGCEPTKPQPNSQWKQLSPEVCHPRFAASAPNSPYDMIFGMALLRHYATILAINHLKTHLKDVKYCTR
ncbi:hypothetical protein T265_03048 [Opisthorchis viverrini]|uniref:Uncharacterized protein n=1 Tax=Opisthorchis viverrini TaxID=6198 RepID=A0A074ZXC0_OPIVI|nr:hypothetical protein T265_03048 [Opisthorchis viverrini]KER30572.1 hypothetical protein T265_03048 [Opisthorchis viverrini]